MLLTRSEQIDTLYAAAQNAGLDVAKGDIRWQDEVVDVAGMKIHYLDWGSKGKRPLLLLHGGMQSAHTWDLIAVAMKRDFHVVAMDLRGHGDSDWSADANYAHAAHMGDILGLIEHLGWDTLSLIGLSMGGLAAMHLAAEHSEKLDALVIVDVGPVLNTSGVGRIANFVSGPRELDSIDDFVKRALEYNPRRRPEQLRYSLTHNLRQLENGKWTWKYDPRFGMRPAQAGQQAPPTDFSELWDKLRKIECPTLVVRGGESDVLPEETALKMQATIPECRLVTVPNAGHTVPQDNAAGFLAEVRPFLEERQPS